MLIFAKSALSFALGHWKAILIALAFAALGLKLLAAQSDARHWHEQSDRYAALYKSERLAHAATIANYRRAAELARAQDAANKARVERDQVNISQEVSHDYQTRLSALRSRYDAIRLRNGSAGAHPGSSGISAVSEAGDGARGSNAAAGEEGFSLADRLIASAQAEQLDALITWVERQQAVSIDQPEKVLPPG